MTLAKGNHLIKISGSSEEIYERFRKFVAEKSFSYDFTDSDLTQLLCPDEHFSLYEVAADAPYLQVDYSTLTVPTLRVLF